LAVSAELLWYDGRPWRFLSGAATISCSDAAVLDLDQASNPSERRSDVTTARPCYGFGPPVSRHALSTWLFRRLLGVVLVIAFVSLGLQLPGLVGSRGLVPVADQLRFFGERLGDRAVWTMPSILWAAPGDGMLAFTWIAGALSAALFAAGVVPLVTLPLAWLFYLSLVHVGGPFTRFQWDALLLETALAGLFVAPARLFDRIDPAHEPPRLGRFVLYWLCFRLMFASGWVKLASGDATWRNLEALTFHYWTQPLPSPLSWYAHWLPHWMHVASCAVMFVIEIGAPFGIFLGRYGRRAAAIALIGLQLLIALTGNYGFFNLLSAAICVPLLDDAFLLRLVPRRWRARLEAGPPAPLEKKKRDRLAIRAAAADVALAVAAWTLLSPAEHVFRWLLIVAAIGWGVFGLLREWASARRLRAREVLARSRDGFAILAMLLATVPFVAGLTTTELPDAAAELLVEIDGLDSFNAYGLFRSMTTERPEIVLEGSRDGVAWIPYELPYKPGAVDRTPRWVPPGHMPRLDWQLWFAALGQRSPWVRTLAERLLDGEPRVLALFAANPFPDAPPRYVRAWLYFYRFATPDERAATGDVWRRSGQRVYLPVVTRR
jgi:lipase maturation factor 1